MQRYITRANCNVENYDFMANKVTALLEINPQVYREELKFHLNRRLADTFLDVHENKSSFYRRGGVSRSQKSSRISPGEEIRAGNQAWL